MSGRAGRGIPASRGPRGGAGRDPAPRPARGHPPSVRRPRRRPARNGGILLVAWRRTADLDAVFARWSPARASSTAVCGDVAVVHWSSPLMYQRVPALAEVRARFQRARPASRPGDVTFPAAVSSSAYGYNDSRPSPAARRCRPAPVRRAPAHERRQPARPGARPPDRDPRVADQRLRVLPGHALEGREGAR